MPMDVTMPDGTVIKGVPDGTSKEAIMQKYMAYQAKRQGQSNTNQTMATETQEPAPVTMQQRPEYDPTLRAVARGARNVLTGAASVLDVPAMAGNVMAGAMRAGIDLYDPDLLPLPEGRKQMAMPSETVSRGIDYLTGGMTAPVDAGERIMDMAQQAVSLGGSAKVGRELAAQSPALLRQYLDFLKAGNLREAAAMAGGGAAAQAGAEFSDYAAVPMVAGAIGGAAAAKAVDNSATRATGRAVGEIGEMVTRPRPSAEMTPQEALSGMKIEVKPNESAYTPESIRKALAALGQESIANFRAASKKGLPPDKAIRYAAAKKYGIPLSKGDLLQDVEIQRMEESARAGNLTPEATERATGFRMDQQQRMKESGKTFASQYGGEVVDEADAVQMAVEKARSIYKSDRAAASARYTTLRDKGEAIIPNDAYEAFTKSVDAMLQDNQYNLKAKFLANTRDSYRSIKEIAKKEKIDFIDIHNLRKELVVAERGAGNASDAGAVRSLKGLVDEFEGDLIANNLVSGDETAIEAARAARTGWANFAQKYYGKDGKKIVGKIIDNDYTPEQAASLLIGSGKMIGTKSAAKGVASIKEVLGKDSAEFGLVKQAAFLRLFGRPFDSFLDADLQTNMSGQAFAKGWAELKKSNKSLADELFTTKEQAEIEEFANLLASATTRRGGAVNYSGTGYYVLGVLNEMLVGLAGTAAGKLQRATLESGAQRQIKENFPDDISIHLRRLTGADTGLAKPMASRIATIGAMHGGRAYYNNQQQGEE